MSAAHLSIEAPLQWGGDLGATRWASPPPAPSWRAYALALMMTDFGLLLITADLAGWLR